MAIYSYQAKSISGQKTSGDIEAIDIEDAKLKLRQMQLVPVKISLLKNVYTRKGTSAGVIDVLFAKKLKSKELQVFTRQFATLINSGITAGDSLRILETGSRNIFLKSVVKKVRLNVEAGKSLGDSMSMAPYVFDNFYCNMIRAGEASGNLDVILNRMATYLEKSEKLKNQIKGAMMYPIIIIALTICAITGILVFVIPKFQEMYRNAGSELPMLTQIIITISTYLRDKWYLFIFTILSLPSLSMAYYGTKEGRNFIDKILIDFPLFGELFVKASVARFTRTMATLLSSGVPLLESIDAASKTVGNVVIEQTLYKCRDSVSVGKTFSEPLTKLAILPPMVAQMVTIGEQTGALDVMMGKVADFYDDEVETVIRSLTTLIEPLMLVIVGGIIAVILIAMYLPIFGMADAVSRGR